jgi:hypothetical protein
MKKVILLFLRHDEKRPFYKMNAFLPVPIFRTQKFKLQNIINAQPCLHNSSLKTAPQDFLGAFSTKVTKNLFSPIFVTYTE